MAPFICLVENQTKGRGRRANQWQNHTGDLLMSYCLQLSGEETKYLTSLSVKLAALIAQRLTTATQQCYFKWPNDLQIIREGQPRKIGGILIESRMTSLKHPQHPQLAQSTSGARIVEGQSVYAIKLVIGVGLNLSQKHHDYCKMSAPMDSQPAINQRWQAHQIIKRCIDDCLGRPKHVAQKLLPKLNTLHSLHQKAIRFQTEQTLSSEFLSSEFLSSEFICSEETDNAFAGCSSNSLAKGTVYYQGVVTGISSQGELMIVSRMKSLRGAKVQANLSQAYNIQLINDVNTNTSSDDLLKR